LHYSSDDAAAQQLIQKFGSMRGTQTEQDINAIELDFIRFVHKHMVQEVCLSAMQASALCQ
jgi:hypothetical protein